jgi:hypothetical protein
MNPKKLWPTWLRVPHSLAFCVFCAIERDLVCRIPYWIHAAMALFLAGAALGQEIPAGTVIPVMLSSSLNAKSDKPEKKIEGYVMQEVTLPDGAKIGKRARIRGFVVTASKQEPSGFSLTLKFNAVIDRGRTIPLKASLLAVGSMDSVSQAQSPINSSSDRDPMSQWVTRQIGGDVVNRGRGKAASRLGAVGTWVEGTSVLIKLTPNPEAGCPGGGPGYDHEQAVWVFSSNACGVYGLSNLKIASSGASAPLGEVVLKSSENVSIRAGSGWLLMAVGSE